MKAKFFVIVSLMLIGGLYVHTVAFSAQYTKQEIEVAKTIAMEACGEGTLGMVAVANVIANRSKQFNISPYEVVSAPHQFVGFTHPNRDKRFSECKRETLNISKNIFTLTDQTNGALYFKTPQEQRRKWHKEMTVIIGNHEFWK